MIFAIHAKKKQKKKKPRFGGRDIGKSRLLDFFYIAKS